MGNSVKICFPTDEHHPYHDPDAITLAMAICEDFDPDIRIAGSDGVDFYSLSKFDKSPWRKKNIDEEVDSWVSWQSAWLDATPNAMPVFILGNHELRLQRYLAPHPEIAELRALQIPNFLRLDEVNVVCDSSRHEMANREFQIHRLVIKHGSIVRKYSGYTAKGELEKEFYQINTLTGHTHRGGVHYATTRMGVVQGVEGFCLCDLHPPYIDKPNWQQGIVLAEAFEDGDVVFEPILFRRRIGEIYARWRGKEYRMKTKERRPYGETLN